MLSRDQILKLASVKFVIPWEKFFEQIEFLPKDLSFCHGDFKKFSRIQFPGQFYEFLIAITKMVRIWHFRQFSHFYPNLDYYKIRTATNFENTNSKSLDLHPIVRFILTELFPDSTDFTVAVFKIPQISKHFSAMLTYLLIFFQYRI